MYMRLRGGLLIQKSITDMYVSKDRKARYLAREIPKPEPSKERGQTIWRIKMTTIQVSVKDLQAKYPDEFKHYHEKFCERQWGYELDTDWVIEGLKEDNKWLDADKIYYSISYSQGDYAYFTGKVDLIKFLDEFDTENDYFVLREAIKLKDCSSVLGIYPSSHWSSNTVFGGVEWLGHDEGYFDEDSVVEPNGQTRSILEGMLYSDYYETCMTLIGDLESWIKTKCEGMFDVLYRTLTDEIEYQQSEEAFVECAESMDEMFDVEIMEEAA